MKKFLTTLLISSSILGTSLTASAEEVKTVSTDKKIETTIFGLPVNEGPIDRSIRAVIGAGLLGTGIYGLTTNSIKPEISWTLVGVSVIPLGTAASGYCPLYSLFNVKYTF
ncbi:MAG: DUF2892 domain-containing protein [Candidatus Sericytochromatia bacterium]